MSSVFCLLSSVALLILKPYSSNATEDSKQKTEDYFKVLLPA